MIKNPSGESLEYIIEGNKESNDLIIFVHGFLMNMNGGNNLFPDIFLALQENFLGLRFSQSGRGDSGGKEEEYSISKSTKDLEGYKTLPNINYLQIDGDHGF